MPKGKKVCPECGFLCGARQAECPDCEYVFGELKKKPSKNDGHGGARAGARSEKTFRDVMLSKGYYVAKTIDDVREYTNFDKEQCVEIVNEELRCPFPEVWKSISRCNGKTPTGEDKTFSIDGWCPQLDLHFELKWSKAHGTTEEKVFYDKQKIEDGVYNNKRLVYLIYGPLAKSNSVFDLMRHKVMEMNKSNVVVIQDDECDENGTPLLNKLFSFIEAVALCEGENCSLRDIYDAWNMEEEFV
jgi:hypothetical protein